MNRPRQRLWAIVYDIEDNGVRRRVHDILNNHGRRVQYSVFECWLTADAVHALRQRLQQQIEPNDSLRWYPLCGQCHPHVERQGKGERAENSDYYLP
jgi:CRISPR-associated protein Cas2